MKMKNDYKEYWKRTLNYDYNIEFKIYKFLCGDMKRWWHKNKVPVNSQFKTYESWKNYVRLSYNGQCLGEIKEFYRYLNNMKRNSHTSYGYGNTFTIPIVATLLAGFFIPKILEDKWSVEVLAIFVNGFSNVHTWQQKFMMLGAGAFFLIIIIVVYIFLGAILSIFNVMVYGTVSNDNKSINFYKDYMEIINDIIEEKEMQEIVGEKVYD